MPDDRLEHLDGRKNQVANGGGRSIAIGAEERGGRSGRRQREKLKKRIRLSL